MDEWDLLEEVDVIALWPKEHQNNLLSSKWQERREALEALVHLIEKNPRLSTASMTIYGEVMDSLKKIIAHDSNVNVVASALRVLTRLARGLRKRFSCYVPMLLPSMLEKAKEKKSVVQDALNEALDAVSDSCDAERIAKDLCEHLLKPNPQSKQCLCLFLFRYFVRQSGLSTDFVKAVLPIVVKIVYLIIWSFQLSSDSNPSVREAACHSLGSARRVLGKSLDAFLIPISSEKAKLEKVEESCSEAKKQHEEFISQKPQSKSSEIYESGDHNEAVDSGAIISSNGLKDDDPWILMTPTDIIVQMRKDFVEMLASKKWQDRKEALDNMLSIVECSPRIATSPELQNIMAMLLKIMPIVFDKLKDKKAVIRNELVRLCDAAATTVRFLSFIHGIHIPQHDRSNRA
ncbi:HEAT repeat protein [Dictyocaulus viviparus]|uniref:HEAT repeat protein n=1 Tax=Dictyocaulus viviparus TaxID=29172 RepID=A0A0D8XND1_DICVI|nr:HEAT repeat protein [Dictyocaulus viviparus]